MKFVFVLAIILSGFTAKSQHAFSLLEDSLTGGLSRTWVQCNNTGLKQTDKNCLRGTEYTFSKKDKTGVKRKCVVGKWVENKFTWVINSEGNKYFIAVVNEESLADNFSIQLMAEDGISTTRLTQKDYDRKDVERFCYKK